MKTAFTYWNKRIAPLFDTARQAKIIETEAGRIVSETIETLASDLSVHKLLRLSELGVSTLVCGAISQSMNEMVTAYGIRVISFVAGDLEEVIKAWLNGNLECKSFSMPGCRDFRHEDKTGQGHGRSDDAKWLLLKDGKAGIGQRKQSKGGGHHGNEV